MDFDLIIKNATIVTAAEVLPPGQSIGIKDGKISCIAQGDLASTSSSAKVIDAQGAYVTPGGVDSHVHLAQANCPTGDGWLTGSRSALAGGNTTLIAFASQQRSNDSLVPVLKDYHGKVNVDGGSYVDYAFHFILTNPTEKVLGELERMSKNEGITSVKLYMTYPIMKLVDAEILDIMLKCRSLGMTVMIHAENSDMIDMITKGLTERGNTQPKFHAVARPQIAESEATNRAISLAHLTDTPMLLVHQSSRKALTHVRKAQKANLPIHSETCPHYLFLRSGKLDSHDPHDHWEGAKHVCAPPLRHAEDDIQFLWDSVNNGTINVISSDHAASKYAHANGKRKPLLAAESNTGTAPVFSQIPNGLPGLETRLPLLFHAATSPEQPAARRISLPKFVALTSTTPAKLYGLDGRKGSIAPGYDADLTVWYPEGEGKGETVVRNEMLHHDIDYTPFEGMRVCNWPRYTVLRGEVKWDRDAGGVVGKVGDGVFLKRGNGKVLVGRTGIEVEGMKEGERRLWM